MSRPHALFVCDGGARVGGGHVMRSLTLAEALAARGWRSTFLADPFVASVMDRHDRSACGRLPVLDCAPETLARAAGAATGFDAVVFDHFGMDARHEAEARARLRVAVDDLADRPHAVDLLVDCNLQRAPADYAALAPGSELLLGPSYAPVRPDFAAFRETSLDRRRRAWRGNQSATHLIISLGLTDLGGVTVQAVEAVLPSLLWTRVDVVVGRDAPSRARLDVLARADPRLSLHSDLHASRLAALMCEADIAVGAGGSSTWERCTVGLPTVVIILAENQAPGALALAAATRQAVLDARTAGWEGRLRNEVEFRACDEWIAEAEGDARLCDGLGAGRTADRLTERLQSCGRQ